MYTVYIYTYIYTYMHIIHTHILSLLPNRTLLNSTSCETTRMAMLVAFSSSPSETCHLTSTCNNSFDKMDVIPLRWWFGHLLLPQLLRLLWIYIFFVGFPHHFCPTSSVFVLINIAVLVYYEDLFLFIGFQVFSSLKKALECAKQTSLDKFSLFL